MHLSSVCQTTYGLNSKLPVRSERPLKRSFRLALIASSGFIANSQSGSMCECGGRTSGWIGAIPKVHGCDTTVVQREYVENFAVR